MRNRTSFQLLVGIALLSVLGATVALYWQGLDGPFLLDDRATIEAARLTDGSFSALLNLLFANQTGSLGRPVSLLSFGLNWLASGPDAQVYKYSNLMLHLLVTVLAFWFMGRLWLTALGPRRFRRAWGIALLGLLLWTIHPLHVSTVLYVVQRMTELAALFTLAALLCFLAGRPWLLGARRGGGWLWVGFPLFAVLGVLSKENAALLPGYVALVEVFLRLFRAGGVPVAWRYRWFHGLFTVVPLLLGLAILLVALPHFMAGYELRSFGMGERLLTEARVVWFYVGQLLLPSLSGMGLFHDDFPITRVPDAGTLAALSGLMLALGLAWRWRRSSPWVLLGVGWFLVGHLLESTILSLELVFEHRNYLPSLGLVMLLAGVIGITGWDRLGRARWWRRAGIGVIVVLIAVMGFQTWSRTLGWSSLDLFTTLSLRDHPDSVRANVAHAATMHRWGADGEARRLLRRAAELAPDDAGAPLQLLRVACRASNGARAIELRDLIAEISERLRDGRITPYATSGLEALLQSLEAGRCSGVLFGLLAEWAGLAITNPRKSRRLAFFLHQIQGRAWMLAGDPSAAVTAYERAFEARRTVALAQQLDPLLELAEQQLRHGSVTTAAATLERVERLNREAVVDQSQRIGVLKQALEQAR